MEECVSADPRRCVLRRALLLGTDHVQIIRKAVSGMLPKNKFRDRRLERLKIYPGAAPPEVTANVLQTWRDQTGGETYQQTTVGAPEVAAGSQEVKV